jgi:hypothetical protein
MSTLPCASHTTHGDKIICSLSQWSFSSKYHNFDLPLFAHLLGASSPYTNCFHLCSIDPRFDTSSRPFKAARSNKFGSRTYLYHTRPVSRSSSCLTDQDVFRLSLTGQVVCIITSSYHSGVHSGCLELLGQPIFMLFLSSFELTYLVREPSLPTMSF